MEAISTASDSKFFFRNLFRSLIVPTTQAYHKIVIKNYWAEQNEADNTKIFIATLK